MPKYRRERRKAANLSGKPGPAEGTSHYNHSFWTDSENFLYLHFLKEFGGLFDSDWQQRKSLRINVAMSQHVKTRSPLQCRSHHQKMMKFHKDIPHIVEHLSKLQAPQGQEEAATAGKEGEWREASARAGSWEESEEWSRVIKEIWLSGTEDY